MSVQSWIATARERSVVRRAVRVSLIVGTILVMINHGDALLNGHFSTVRVIKILLTYLVPYCVSTYASVGAIHQLRGHE